MRKQHIVRRFKLKRLMKIKNLQDGLAVGPFDIRLFSVERDTELSFVEK